MDNVLITPHIGGSTEEAILAMGMAAIKGLKNPKDPLASLFNFKIYKMNLLKFGIAGYGKMGKIREQTISDS